MVLTTYSDVSSVLPDIYEAARLFYLETFALPQIVRNYRGSGMSPRHFSEYTGGSAVDNVPETTSLTGQTFARSETAVITPKEIGMKYDITDRRVESDNVDVIADAVRDVTYNLFSKVESDIVGTFSNFTAGTVGQAGQPLTFNDIYKARAILAAARVPPPYNLVVSEFQWYVLATSANIAALSAPGSLSIRDDIQNRYYVANLDNDIRVFTTPSIAAGTSVVASLFHTEAIALDIRRPFRLETERDPSARSTQLVATMVYGAGVIRPTWGVTIVSDGSI